MLIESLKGIGQTVVELLRTRLEILSLDVKEDRIRFISILMLGASAFLLLALGIILGIFMLIITFWDTDRTLVLGILTASLLICGLFFLVLLIRRIRHGSGLFEGTIAELEKDHEALGGRGKRYY